MDEWLNESKLLPCPLKIPNMSFLVNVGGGVSGPGDPSNLITLLFQNWIGNSSAKMIRKNSTGRAAGGVVTPPSMITTPTPPPMITTPHVCTKHFLNTERNFRHGNGEICINQTRDPRSCGERKRHGIRTKNCTGEICINQTRDPRLFGERKRHGIWGNLH